MPQGCSIMAIHFLDAAPFDLSLPGASELLRLMATAYSTVRRAEMIASTRIDCAHVDWNGPPRDVWFSILQVAASAGKLRELAQAAADDPAIAGYRPQLLALMSDPQAHQDRRGSDSSSSTDGYSVVTAPEPATVADDDEGARATSAKRLRPSIRRLPSYFVAGLVSLGIYVYELILGGPSEPGHR